MNTIKTVGLSLIAGIGGALLVNYFSQTEDIDQYPQAQVIENEPNNQVSQVAYSTIIPNENFIEASEKSTGSVVFIQTLSEVEYRTGGWMDWFFEPRSSQRVGSGSGVVFSKDGHIVTNNHVIMDADEITVIAGKRSYEAELIGRDPSTDLAVIKINSSDLPAIEKGDSEQVKVGEWVLAVGNPFNLTSTVTAGIVSAKGRNINILRDKFPIESFIQTDAAINPGNSGGALVNANGKLIGINTAILSRTGSYAGYGFAIPVNIVKKVFNDLVKYGEVQKAFTGAEFIDIDSELASRIGIQDLDGVIITEVKDGSAAEKAGLKKRDVIRKINGKQINSKANLEELIAKSYPGDKLNIIVERDNEMLNREMILTNREGTTKIITRDIYYAEDLDASFESVSKVERDLLGINSGVKVVDFKTNGFFSNLGIPKGFIITQINNRSIDKPEELAKILENIRGRFDVIGIDERGRKVYYPFRR
ncbi:Do/DeqQ family serine protease [Ekhidna lutea]|uniref:Do/DeqQ family serine protease n=1 Tax=Ekhidna lutea TaxID=447679 RepID=A0A239KDP9_EKHLU|nr:trypsin-like peptidase domain-containing protein [Ekhidna lutea]SNT15779.1 Do/DeqQ family serine protease [Ekhidna lutea]